MFTILSIFGPNETEMPPRSEMGLKHRFFYYLRILRSDIFITLSKHYFSGVCDDFFGMKGIYQAITH
jgi:hypothetical protein